MHMRRSRTVPLIWHWTGCRKNEIGMEKCVCFEKELIREKQCILMAPDHPLAQKKMLQSWIAGEYTMLTGLEHSVEDRLLRKTYGEQNITWKESSAQTASTR